MGFLQVNATAKVTNYSESNAILWEYFSIFPQNRANTRNKTIIMTTYLRFIDYDTAFDYYCDSMCGNRPTIIWDTHYHTEM